MRFGPADAAIDPASITETGIDYDADGIDDARFHFITGDTGITCDDTEMTLTGDMISGAEFVGIDTDFETACDDDGCH